MWSACPDCACDRELHHRKRQVQLDLSRTDMRCSEVPQTRPSLVASTMVSYCFLRSTLLSPRGSRCVLSPPISPSDPHRRADVNPVGPLPTRQEDLLLNVRFPSWLSEYIDVHYVLLHPLLIHLFNAVEPCMERSNDVRPSLPTLPCPSNLPI